MRKCTMPRTGRQAAAALQLGVTFDLCAMPTRHGCVDVATLKFLPLFTGGLLLLVPEARLPLMAEVML